MPPACTDPWFFAPAPVIGPAGPALAGHIGWQHFEHGQMAWVEAKDEIEVLYDLVEGVCCRWATSAESDLGEGAYQCDSAPRYVTCYLTGRNGDIVAVQMGAWTVVPGAAEMQSPQTSG